MKLVCCCVALSLGAAACTAGGDEPTAVAETTSPSVSNPSADGAPEPDSQPEVAPDDRLSSPASSPASTAVPIADPVPRPATSVAATADVGDSEPPTSSSPPSTAIDEVEADEPVFDLGETVELNVDLARFPVDDAGQGAGGATGAPEAGDGAASTGDTGVSAVPTGWAGFDASLEAALMRPGNTAASVAVMIDGDLVHTASFGVRDPLRGDPAAPTDRFRIASISKPITAIVALQLVEDGLIGLDDPIGELVGDHIGTERVTAGASRLTLRQLLSHTSGFGKYRSEFFGAAAADCVDAARIGLARGAGGGGYVYSNMNYCLAGLVIEAVTGESLERATYRLLLTPLGLSGMRLAPTIDPGPGEVQHRTTPGRNYMETLAGAGSWVASSADLVTILDSLDHATPGFKPLDPGTSAALRTPVGGQPGQRGYGLGLISYGGGRVGHTGTIEATHAMALDRGDGVVWAVTVAGDWPSESTALERLVDEAFAAGGFVAG